MKTIYIILFNVFSIIIVNAQPKNLFTPEVKELLEEINVARSNPELYGINNNLQSERLDTILSKEPLNLNYKLCQKAHSYAEYLGKAKYNESNVVCKHSIMGYHESIAFNAYLNKICKQLIYDKGQIFKGHRYHLLSTNNKDTKVGIGISYIVQLDWYVVVIITE